MFRNPVTDLIVVVVVALLIFGPKRLPMLGRALGQGMREFKDGITGESKTSEEEERPALTPAATAAPVAPPAPAATPEPVAPPPAATPSPTAARARVRLGGVAAPSRPGVRGVAKVLRPIGHEERLSIVDHLDELRSRLIVCLAALIVAFGLCFWQNPALLHVLNRALPQVQTAAGQHGLGAEQNQSARERAGLQEIEQGARGLAASPGLSARDRAFATIMAEGAAKAAKALPQNLQTQEKPVTIGPGEPFMTSMAVAIYFALLFTLPVVLYEAYGFILPALNPEEKRTAVPLMVVAPVLFVIGVVFTYLVILPPALHFLQGYNSDQYDILIQAKSFYTFEFLTMLGVGIAFQLPLGLLGLHRLGVIEGRTLTRHWRYAAVIIAVIAAAMPGSDPVTTGLETLPLVVLYLVSIVVLRIADRRAAQRAAADAATQSFDQGLGIP